MAYRSFLEVLAGSHPPRYAASLKPSSPKFIHSSPISPERALLLARRDDAGIVSSEDDLTDELVSSLNRRICEARYEQVFAADPSYLKSLAETVSI